MWHGARTKGRGTKGSRRRTHTRWHGTHAPALLASFAPAPQVLVRADSVLIVTTKGGGHAFLGLHLARKLLKDGHKVTILNDGDQVGAAANCG